MDDFDEKLEDEKKVWRNSMGSRLNAIEDFILALSGWRNSIEKEEDKILEEIKNARSELNG